MRLPSFFVHAFLVGLVFVSSSGCQSASFQEDESFSIVAIRRPSDVAMSAPPPMQTDSMIGAKLFIGDTLEWIDGSVFENWISIPLNEPALHYGDPILEDVYYGLEAPEDVRQAVDYVEGEKTIGRIYWVDSRVGLIAPPSGSPVYVIEKTLGREKALMLEAALETLGFQVGVVDGRIDSETRSAIGAYLDGKGLSYRYASPVISEALLREVLSAQ